jgi:hypothetical protein
MNPTTSGDIVKTEFVIVQPRPHRLLDGRRTRVPRRLVHALQPWSACTRPRRRHLQSPYLLPVTRRLIMLRARHGWCIRRRVLRAAPNCRYPNSPEWSPRSQSARRIRRDQSAVRRLSEIRATKDLAPGPRRSLSPPARAEPHDRLGEQCTRPRRRPVRPLMGDCDSRVSGPPRGPERRHGALGSARARRTSSTIPRSVGSDTERGRRRSLAGRANAVAVANAARARRAASLTTSGSLPRRGWDRRAASQASTRSRRPAVPPSWRRPARTDAAGKPRSPADHRRAGRRLAAEASRRQRACSRSCRSAD